MTTSFKLRVYSEQCINIVVQDVWRRSRFDYHTSTVTEEAIPGWGSKHVMVLHLQLRLQIQLRVCTRVKKINIGWA